MSFSFLMLLYHFGTLVLIVGDANNLDTVLIAIRRRLELEEQKALSKTD